MLRKLFVIFMVMAMYWVMFPASTWQLSKPFLQPSPADAQAVNTVSPPCGTPAWTASPGAPVNAENLDAEILHLEACAGNAAAFPTTSPPVIGTGSPPTFTIVTGNCLAITGGVLLYNCATPAPLTAGNCTSPRPTGSFIAVDYTCGGGQGAIVGSSPCITTAPTTNPAGGVVISYTCTNQTVVAGTCVTASPTANPTGGTVLSYNCATPVPTPTGGCATIGCYPTPNAFESAVLARADVTHFWEMHEAPVGGVYGTPGPCPTGTQLFQDAVINGATALASPVPLSIVTQSPNPLPICGGPPILNNTVGTSVGSCFAQGFNGCSNGANTSSGPYIDIPLAVELSNPYTVFCILRPTQLTLAVGDEQAVDINGNRVRMGYTDGNASYSLVAVENQTADTGMYKVFMVLSVGTSQSTYYINGIPMAAPTSAPTSPPVADGGFLGAPSQPSTNYSGWISDCGLANTAWSAATVEYLYSLTGF
jgi:hypothetical protein